MESLLVLVLLWFLFGKLTKGKDKKDNAGKAGKSAARRGTTSQSAQQTKKAAPRKEQICLHEEQYPLERKEPETIHVTERDEQLFAGSMDAHSDEGEDPCHEGELRPERIAVTDPENFHEEEIQHRSLPWDQPDSLVNAFVMQEILKRPSDRRR